MVKSLNDLEKFSKDLEKERIDAYAGIKRQITDLGIRTESLGKEASNLSTALRKSSSVRGDWGEIALRNLLEMAGMTKHTDFLEQKGASGLIPDVVVRLPGDGSIPIDAKTSGKHYLEALEIENLDARQEKLIQHAGERWSEQAEKVLGHDGARPYLSPLADFRRGMKHDIPSSVAKQMGRNNSNNRSRGQRREMHKTTCTMCSKSTEVPFKVICRFIPA